MQQQAYSLFGQTLVEKGVISQKQLDEAIHKQQTTMGHRKLGEILVRLGYLSKSHITEGLAEQLGIPIVRLSDREIPERIRNLVEPNIATLYRIIPIGEAGDRLIIATADPTNFTALENVERLLERPVEPQLAPVEDIAEALSKYYGLNEHTVESMLTSVSSASTMSTLSTMSNVSSLDSSMSSVSSMSASDISMSSISVDATDFNVGTSDDSVEDDDHPVVRYVHNLILEAFRLRASDIHVEPGKYDVKIRYRIDGVLHLMPPPPKRAQPSIISRLKLLSNMDLSERRIPQDGRIKLNIGGKMVDLRVSALPAQYGESVVMRILDKSGLMLGLGQLGFSPDDQRRWEDMLNQGTGVMLVTGPTGSGKTTTLYASLHKLNTPDRKLVTVEDPVEYQLSGINQVQINHEIGWKFDNALRAIFRQDPDIVMVGEIRDYETADIAIKAALTGHMVFSTVHTNDAPSSFIRLVDIGLKPFMVAAGVRCVLAQRLVRTLCTTCKEPTQPTDLQLERLGIKFDVNEAELFDGKGCEHCNHTGYQGRIGIYELLVTTDRLRELIINGASASHLRVEARASGGMLTLREDAWRKALAGITSLQEVLRVTQMDEPV
ncbi:MAG TPA: ATPase, T2SS/T4P/T4SS family [Candidatus Hydrogenedentes bacterium]|nr:ATPase, T2SS/T4P/T4SS family [Candidatus Hydrogenedentota bacterium]